MKTLSRTCTVAGLATVLTAFAGATAAQAATVTLPDEGTLLADGAGISVSVSFDCDSDWTGSVWIEAAQVVEGHRLATGAGYSDSVDCGDGEESVDVVLLAAGDYVPFTDGDAVVRVTVSACNTETCEQAVEAGVVPLQDED
ncbi:MAG: hypothetical protein QJR09_00165 [Micrococcus sp.]|nr:hypothetical protein [Micrococcus sp.]